MRYKKTMYMHKTRNGEEVLLLNTLNSITLRAHGFKADEVEKCLENPNENQQLSMFQSLIDTGFIVDDNINEYEKAEKIFYESRKNNCKLLHLIILPTEDCNFRCWYCYEEHNKGKMKETVVDSIVKYVEKNIDRYETLLVGWFGGEPLKAMDVIESLSIKLMNICKARGKQYMSSITTNGYLLTPSVFLKMMDYEIRDFQITLDGTEEVHNKQRYLENHVGTYRKIVDNLRYIRDHFQEEEFTIHIRTNISAEVYEVLDEHIAFLEKEFSTEKFSHLMKITWECGAEKKTGFLKNNILPQSTMHEVLKKCRNSKLCFEMNMKQHFLFGQVCYGSSKHSFVIGADGNVYKCTIHMDSDSVVGKLQADGTMRLNQQLFCQWTEKCMAESEYEKCRTCSVYPICYGISCPNRNGDRVLACPGTKEYIDDYLTLFSTTENHYTFYDYDFPEK